MTGSKASILAIAAFFFSSLAQAKVFNFGETPLATFIEGQYGNANVADQAYGQAGGASNVFDQGVERQFAGDVGLIFVGQRVNFVVAAELLRPKEVVDATGSTPSGGALMKLNSRINAVVGTAGFEFLFRQRPRSRFHFGLLGSYADVTVANDFTLNSAGQAAFPGVAGTYRENLSGNGVGGRAYLGAELLLADNVTFSIDFGYRYLMITNLVYANSETTVNGSVDAGQAARNSDNSLRTLDLGGGYGAISLRFYFL